MAQRTLTIHRHITLVRMQKGSIRTKSSRDISNGFYGTSSGVILSVGFAPRACAGLRAAVSVASLYIQRCIAA